VGYFELKPHIHTLSWDIKYYTTPWKDRTFSISIQQL